VYLEDGMVKEFGTVEEIIAKELPFFDGLTKNVAEDEVEEFVVILVEQEDDSSFKRSQSCKSC